MEALEYAYGETTVVSSPTLCLRQRVGSAVCCSPWPVLVCSE